MLRAERGLRHVEIRRHIVELDPRFVCGVEWQSVHGEFSQRTHPVERTTRAVGGKIWVCQQLDAEGGDILKIVREPEMRAGLGDGVTLRDYRAVRLARKLLSTGRDVFCVRLNRDPLWLFLRHVGFPLRHALFPIGHAMPQTFFDVTHLARKIRNAHLICGRIDDAL